MEEKWIKKVEEQSNFFKLICLIYAIITTFLFYKTRIGINVFLWVMITFGFSILLFQKIGIKIKKYSFLYVGGMILLSISCAYTSSLFFHIFNIIGILFLYFLFCMEQFHEEKNFRLVNYIVLFFLLLKNMVMFTAKPYQKEKKSNLSQFKFIIIGGILGLVLAFLLLPLLISSDPLFGSYLKKGLKHIRIGFLFEIIFLVEIFYHLSVTYFYSICKKEERKKKNSFY